MNDKRPPTASGAFFISGNIASLRSISSLGDLLMRIHFSQTLRFSSVRVALILLGAMLIAATGQAQSFGALHGVVRDSLGGGVSGAQVTVEGSPTRTVTDASGMFRLSKLAAGEFSVHVRRLGYRPTSIRARIESGTNTQVEVALSPIAARLPVVEVKGKGQVYDSRLAGFNARKERQAGHFVTRERLDAFSSARFVDVLREIPGVKIRTLRGGVTTVRLRGARCSPLVFMDGFAATAGVMDLDMIDLASVEGIEVYSGSATVPAEFSSVRGLESCGVIAVWSRPFRNRQRRQAPIDLEALERLITERKVYTADQVDQPAVLVRSVSAPVYPDSLWQASVSGGAVAEFVVDTDGFIESATLRIVSATHPYFASAVRSSLEGAMFRAANLGGRTVRQMVQLPFRFERKDLTPLGGAIKR
jgi:hypothetical protein